MTRHELRDLYFEWMYQLVYDEKKLKRLSYRKLLSHLHDIPFEYTIGMDSNRAEDGVDLRYRFGYENDIDSRLIATFLDDRDCSVLEMIIALTIRCEEQIMDNPNIGNRTSQWFWSIIKNLGLYSMSDEDYDGLYVNKTIERFLNREYKPNGDGGLFKIPDCRHDLRTAEIWYQAMWYFDDVLSRE